ncbi:MAG: glycoside hydrolase family 130 protein [Proteiniphilum sp.]|nr:glycoside hydrolase family 130 protein [Proteiniphilum sp.]
MIEMRRHSIHITPSSRRTLVRPFVPASKYQVEHILFRAFAIPKKERKQILQNACERIEVSSEVIQRIFLRHFSHIEHRIPSNIELSKDDKRFIGAFFTQQYALESTALFNPSIVPHPVQDKEGVLRFIISLRAVGEGHISSITFMEGEIDADLNISVAENSPIVYEPERFEHHYEKELMIKKSHELGILTNLNRKLFDNMPDEFSYEELTKAINRTFKENTTVSTEELEVSMNNIRSLALSNFSLDFTTNDLTERAIYPASPSQSNGLEDARFVRFVHDDQHVVYYATFTAYNGKTIMPEFLETSDFKSFKISTLNGPGASNKGMALFPRKINGNYMMLGRQDNESLYIMKSDNLYFWHEYQPLLKPTYDWELIQIGNCGSPIEIDEGWLVITHGVGPVRTYSLGVVLLDKENPLQVIGRLKKPLLTPSKEERSGYVPNVIYTCGAMVVNRTLVLPYAIGDVVTTFATIRLDDLLHEMKHG